jgi:stage II sporulation protein D
VKVTKRGVSPRIVSAKVVGSKGTTVVSGPQLRKRLGLYDTWAYFINIKTGQRNTPTQPQPTPHEQVTDGGGVTAKAAWLRRMFAPRQLVVAGTVTPVATKITLQRLGRRGWTTIGYGTTNRRGRYALLVNSTGLYRVLTHGAVGPVVRVR